MNSLYTLQVKPFEDYYYIDFEKLCSSEFYAKNSYHYITYIFSIIKSDFYKLKQKYSTHTVKGNSNLFLSEQSAQQFLDKLNSLITFKTLTTNFTPDCCYTPLYFYMLPQSTQQQALNWIQKHIQPSTATTTIRDITLKYNKYSQLNLRNEHFMEAMFLSNYHCQEALTFAGTYYNIKFI